MRHDIDFSLGNLVGNYLKNNVFSACSVGIIDARNNSFLKETFHYGFTDLKSGVSVDEKTVFDLASLTKPLVVTLSILTLEKRGLLRLEDPLAIHFQHSPTSFKQMRIIQLLEHNSGLVAHREFFKTLIQIPEGARSSRLRELIEGEIGDIAPGEREEYSDLGFMLLGMLIERISGKTISEFWMKEIAAPFHLQNALFFVDDQKREERVFSLTGRCNWSNLELSGHVNDDNCRSVGGVAGHAGLFGTTKGVLDLVELLLKSYGNRANSCPFSLHGLVRRLKETDGRWVLGFDTPTGERSSSGTHFSRETIGHLGFTGTSFWLDLSQKIGVVLLTNRVLCGRDLAGIQEFRPAVHDLIMEKLMDVR